MTDTALLVELHQENVERLEAIAAEIIALREDKETDHTRLWVAIGVLWALVGGASAGMMLSHLL